jgi:hypothetical protein
MGVKADLAGKHVKCPKCHEPFVVEAPDSEDIQETPHKPAARPRPHDERMQDERPRKVKAPVDDDEDGDDEKEHVPHKKPKRKKQKSSAMLWVLVGGGAALVAVVAIILVVVLAKGSDKKGSDDSVGTKYDTPDRGPQKPIEDPTKNIKPPDPFAGIDTLPWPDPGAFRGANPDADSVITVRILLVGDSWKKSKMAIQGTEGAILARIDPIAGDGAKVGGTDDGPDGDSRLIVKRYGGVKLTPDEFANKINIGIVHGIKDRIITLIVKRAELP